MHSGEEEVSTLFIVGFPSDVQHRELDNLCRFLPGFETSNVTTSKGLYSLFAKFDCPRSAHAAISALNGQPFDRNSSYDQPIRAAMAKSNMRSGSHHAAHGADAGHSRYQQHSQAQGQGYNQGGGGYGGGAGYHHGGYSANGDHQQHQGYSAASPPGLRPQMQQASYDYNAPPSSEKPGGGAKRSWPTEGNQVDTVASVGAADVGYDMETLRAWFACQPGFLEFKGNSRMGGGFAKFESVALAADAIAQATQEGLPAAFARTSMQSTAASRPDAQHESKWDQQYVQQPHQQQMQPQQQQMLQPQTTHHSGQYPVEGKQQQADSGMAPAWQQKRQRTHENLPDIDTVACVGALEAGFDECMLQSFFSEIPGFVAFKPNARMGGGFAKFMSVEQAIGAIQLARETGIPIDMARSSMGSVPGSVPPGSSPAALPGSI